MEEEFVKYTEALALKELGFNEPCFGYRDGGSNLMIQKTPHCVISAPTFSQAFRWFREKYKMFSHLDQNAYGKYYYDIHNRGEIFFDEDYFESHEEAELACLKKLIEIVKEK